MRWMAGWLLGLGLFVFGVTCAAAPSTEFDRKVNAELTALDPGAVDLFERANAARDRADHATAEKLYGEVFARVPAFLHAERRRCGELVEAGRRDEGLKLCMDAADKDPSAPNLTMLAVALIHQPRGAKPSDGDLDRAQSFLEKAAALEPNDTYVVSAQCEVATFRPNSADLSRCTAELERLAPNTPQTIWYQWLLAMSEGRLDAAEKLVAQAQKAGAPPELVAAMAKGTADNQPWTTRAVRWAAVFFGGWALLSALLVLGGILLSRATLRTAESWNEESAARSAMLRAIYRPVLVICSAFYYVSLPLVLVTVVAAAGIVVYSMFAVGWVSIQLGLIVVIGAFASVAAIFKSVTFRPRDEAPGVRVDLSSEPELRATLDEVAARVGTRTVDTVFMSPDTNLAVFERKRGERCLVLGAGVLDGMELSAFKAILAHEYGHFSNRDTAGGGFALRVRRSLLVLIVGLARSGHAAPWNPAWLFANGFHRLFLSVSQGASRLQEILADRHAAEAYGGAAFVAGLKHVIACDLSFQTHVTSEINRALKSKEPLQGLWSLATAPVGDLRQLDEALNRKPTPYDSHPAPSDRIRWVEAIAATAPVSERTGATAWSLFRNRAGQEREMTQLIYERLAESGVRPVAPPAM